MLWGYQIPLGSDGGARERKPSLGAISMSEDAGAAGSKVPTCGSRLGSAPGDAAAESRGAYARQALQGS